MPANWKNEIYTKTTYAMNYMMAYYSTIQWFEVNMSQNKPAGSILPQLYPSVLFSYQDVIWFESGNTLGRTLGLVKFQVDVTHEIDDTEELLTTQENGRNGEIRRNNDLEDIFFTFNNLSGSTFGPLRRISSSEEYDPENMLVTQKNTYLTNVYSDGAHPPGVLQIQNETINNLATILSFNKCCK
jgi:hypothetical protein